MAIVKELNCKDTTFFVEIQILFHLFCVLVYVSCVNSFSPSGAEALDPVAGGLQLDGLGIELLEGLRDIGGFDALEVVAACGEDAISHGGDDPIMDELIDPAGIAEVGHFLSQSLTNDLLHFSISLIGEDILITLEQLSCYLHQLVSRVIVELIAEGEAA